VSKLPDIPTIGTNEASPKVRGIFNLLRGYFAGVNQAGGLPTGNDLNRSMQTITLNNTTHVPPQPVGVVATGGFAKIVLQWDDPHFEYLAYTEIFRSTGTDVSAAARVGTTNATVYSDTPPALSTSVAYNYWVRHISNDNTPQEGPFSAMVSAATANDPAYLLEVLTDQLTDSQLHADLTSRIDLIDTPSTGLVALVGQAQAQITSVTNQLNSLVIADFDAATAYVIDNTVKYLSNVYQCIQNTTPPSPLPTDTDYWVLVGAFAGDVAAQVAADAAAAATSASEAAGSAASAVTSASTATTKATAAGNSATAANSSAVAAAASKDAAAGSATAAAGSASSAGTSATNAGNSATAASGSATTATTKAGEASTSAGQASTSAGQASTSASNAAGSASAAATSATAAATSATNAGNSASAASTSANTASTKAGEASTSATAAAGSATTATTKAGEANTYAGQASTSVTNAAGSATTAGNYASAAATSATNAGNSATAAATSASTATTKAGEAGTSATAAASSATSASSSAANALTYKNNAAQSATDASGYATASAQDYSALTARLNNAGGTGVTVEAISQANADSISGLNGKYTVKIDINGYTTGYGIAATANNGTPVSEFIYVGSKFRIAPVATDPNAADGAPFYHLTVPSIVDGVTIPAGTYMKKAFITDLTSVNIRAASIAVDRLYSPYATLAQAIIGTGHITNAMIGNTIQSTNYVAGSTGWKLDKAGTLEIGSGGSMPWAGVVGAGKPADNATAGAVLNKNPQCSDAAMWTGGANGTANIVTGIAGGVTGNTAIRGIEGGGNHWTESWVNKFPIDRSRIYKISCLARKSQAGTGGTLYLGLYHFAADGSDLGYGGSDYTYWTVGAGGLTTGFTRHSVTVAANSLKAGASFSVPHVIPGYLSTSGYIELQDVRVEDITDAYNAALTANSAASTLSTWTRPSTTLIDGNKIYTGDAYVDTLQIKGDAVTVPWAASYDSPILYDISESSSGNILTITIDTYTANRPFLVTASARLDTNSSTAYFTWFMLRYDTTIFPLASQGAFIFNTNGGFRTSGTQLSHLLQYGLPIGTYSFRIDFIIRNSAGATITVPQALFDCVISCRGTKR